MEVIYKTDKIRELKFSLWYLLGVIVTLSDVVSEV